MAPFDGPGGPQNGNPAVAPPPLARPPPLAPPGHGQHNQMQPHHGGPPPMNTHPSYHPRNPQMGMPPYGMPPQSPAGSRQASFGGMHGGNQFSNHAPLHSPHQQSGGMQPHHMQQQQQQQPPQPPQQQGMHRTGSSMNRQGHSMPMHEMRNSSSNSHAGRQQGQQQHYMNQNSGGSGGMGSGGNWQSDKDTAHRREMIQHM